LPRLIKCNSFLRYISCPIRYVSQDPVNINDTKPEEKHKRYYRLLADKIYYGYYCLQKTKRLCFTIHSNYTGNHVVLAYYSTHNICTRSTKCEASAYACTYQGKYIQTSMRVKKACTHRPPCMMHLGLCV